MSLDLFHTGFINPETVNMEVSMKTQEGESVICVETGKICYTEREAGIIMNKARSHFYEDHMKTRREHFTNSKDIPRRKYYCKNCGYFHVTHMSHYNGDKRISDRYACEDKFYREYGKKQALA